MEPIKTYEVEENGIVYEIQEFVNGAVIKSSKDNCDPIPTEDILTESEQTQLEMAANIAYLTQLMEINMEG